MEETILNTNIDKISKKNTKNLILFKEMVKEVLSESTMHGLSKTIKSKSWTLKLMWLVTLTLSICFFTKLSANSVSNFLSYEVTTKIRRVYESPTIFPTVTICNKNKFTTVYFYNYLFFTDHL